MGKLGLWVANGHPGDSIGRMYSWKPKAVTCFFDYLQANRVVEYKSANPDTIVIVRIQHPMNWRHSPERSAVNFGREVASKWTALRQLDPYVYFANEMNLHYENGDTNPGNQWSYTTPTFYAKYADWVENTAKVVKDIAPEMRLITPPFAFGHNEDGEPDEDGEPKLGWAGYDYLVNAIEKYFDKILTFHAYWGDASGEKVDRLYDEELSSWYAYRWKRLLRLFSTRYGIDCRLIIDEAGNFQASSETFTDQCQDFAKNCFSDERVLAVTFFLWLDPTYSPGNMPNSWFQNISESNLDRHLKALSDLSHEVPQPPPPPTSYYLEELVAESRSAIVEIRTMSNLLSEKLEAL